jgi:hypothetical protein
MLFSSSCCLSFLVPSTYIHHHALLYISSSKSGYKNNGRSNMHYCRESNSGRSALRVTVLTELSRSLHFGCKLTNRGHRINENGGVAKPLPLPSCTVSLSLCRYQAVRTQDDSLTARTFIPDSSSRPLYCTCWPCSPYLACNNSDTSLLLMTLRDRFH